MPFHHEDGNSGAVVVDKDKVNDIQAQVEQKGVKFINLVEDAKVADEDQHVDLGVLTAFRTHWKAALWSMAISTCLVMEGYDLVIINSFYGQRYFKNKFGELDPATGNKIITAPWQTGLSNSALCGEIIGLGINGWASERFGYRRTLMAALAGMFCTIFAPVFAPSLPVLALGEVLQGIPWGMFQTLTTAFAVEICPQTLRHYLTTYVCFCWGLGIFLSSVVVRATLNMTGEWSWRLPFVLQWVWPVPLFLCAYYVPESPWWLVRKGRFEDAKDSLRRLATKKTYSEKSFEQTVAMMVHTSALEKAETKGASWLDCFRGINLRRTEIVCVTWAFQWLCGNPLMSYSVVFYQRAGISETNAFNLNIVMNTTYMIGTVISWKLMDHIGRRTIYTSGGVISCLVLALIGGLGFGPSSNTSISWAIGSLLIAFAFFYNCTIGPVCYSIVSEIPSGRLRAKSIVLARLTYNLTGLVTNTLTPRMLSPDAWNWGAKGALLYLGTCALVTLWCFFRLPETRHRSFGEVELLFEKRISARKFSSIEVNQFATHGLGAPLERTGSQVTDSKSSYSEKDSNRVVVATLDH